MVNLKAVDAPSFQRQPVRTGILAKAGFKQPEEHQAIADRLAGFTALGEPVTRRLIDAVVTGQGDVEALRAGALAEWDGDVRRLNEIVSNGVAEAQGRIVREAAADIFEAVQAEFNLAAAAFSKAAAVIDPETPAVDVIAAGNLKSQSAWQDAAVHAAELDRLLVPLIAAALDAGVAHPAAKDAEAGSRAPKTHSLMLGLVIDTSGVANIRDVWSALDAEGRTGAWGQFLKVGAKIAAKGLDSYEPLRKPAPLFDKKVDRGDGTFGWVTVDPELGPEEPVV